MLCVPSIVHERMPEIQCAKCERAGIELKVRMNHAKHSNVKCKEKLATKKKRKRKDGPYEYVEVNMESESSESDSRFVQ